MSQSASIAIGAEFASLTYEADAATKAASVSPASRTIRHHHTEGPSPGGGGPMRTVVGMFDNRDSAESAITRLMADGVDRDSIGIAMKDVREATSLSDDTGTHDLSAEGATAGVVSGAGVGAMIGLALVGSTVLLPGVGTFVIGGPIAAGLIGAGIGAVSGGLIGGLIGAGIPEEEAHHYAAGIHRGEIFVSANVSDDRVAEARRIFDEEGSTRTYAPEPSCLNIRSNRRSLGGHDPSWSAPRRFLVLSVRTQSEKVSFFG